ncbi:hypothetical protein [Pedobacter sp. SYSU D00535]|nr:hypothetical protein [Pedobacter sp. SYSU D00535]
MEFKTRNYRYKGVNPGNEKNNFWLMVLIALVICAAIIYFF